VGSRNEWGARSELSSAIKREGRWVGSRNERGARSELVARSEVLSSAVRREGPSSAVRREGRWVVTDARENCKVS
jgi:hypothetical protein